MRHGHYTRDARGRWTRSGVAAPTSSLDHLETMGGVVMLLLVIWGGLVAILEIAP